MTPEAQRIAIAEAVPEWRASHGGKYCAFISETTNPAMQGIFDPLLDLNAMHEAEEVLTDDQHERMCAELLVRTNAPRPFPDLRWGTVRNMVRATAAQRAEAFLRTLNLWTDA